MISSFVPLLAVFAVISLATTWCFQSTVWLRLHRARQLPDFSPPVSILKPLAGVDEGLLDNLRSIARQDYPLFEIVFGVADPLDPALAVVERLQQEFPEVAIRVVVGSPELGHNPKVTNLAGMAKIARYPYLLISDANVRVRPNYLRAIAAECSDGRVGLVCNIIAGSQGISMGALFEDLHLSTSIAPAVCGAMTMGNHPCVVGKSMLMRSRDLQALGGWHGVRNILAEDYVLGQRFHAAGWKVMISPHVVEAVHLRRSLREFVSRHIRWAQMRRRLVPMHYLCEILLVPTAGSMALAGLACLTARPNYVVLAATLIALRCAGDTALMHRLTGRRLATWQVAAIPLKDCLVSGIWLVGAFRRRVIWRGHSMRIGRGSVVYAPHEMEPDFMLSGEAPVSELS